MISWRHVTQCVRYVPHGSAEDYCRLGWCITDAFDGTPHAAYSVLCAWLCGCRPIEPQELRNILSSKFSRQVAPRELRP